MSRTREEIKREIEVKFGFFPPFFEAALAAPSVLENLWFQTQSAYLENPIPTLFKEKLATLLARNCRVSYCLVCHCSSLVPLGMSARDILALVEQPILSFSVLKNTLGLVEKKDWVEWPHPGSYEETKLLALSVSAFVSADNSEPLCALRLLLPDVDYKNLILFLSYNRTCHSWAEANPEISFEVDERARKWLTQMLIEEPLLPEFFNGYFERFQAQIERRHQIRSEQNQKLLELENELHHARLLAEAANLTKASFLANMSHEIRTPLGAILGFTELLKDSTLNPSEFDQYLRVIHRNGQALAEMIDDILDLSKAESSNLVFSDLEFPPLHLLREVMEVFVEKANAKKIRLALDVAPNVPTMIVSDPTRLRQILINIIGNAMKFTNEGRVIVRVTSSPIDISDHSILSILVEDSGPGLSPEQREKIFKPFVQADESSTREFGGIGLGLALAQKLAQGLGGDVQLINSDAPSGCKFAITVKVSIPCAQKTEHLRHVH